MTDFNSSLTTNLPANIVVPQVSNSFGEIIKKIKDSSDEFLCIRNISFGVEEESALLTYQDEMGNTLIHYAINKGWFLVLNTLLQKGFDPAMRNNAGATPLIQASQLSDITNNHYTCIKLLLAFACKKGISLINIADNQGFTALHLAVSFYNIKLVELLLEKGADFNQKNKLGWSPLFMVASSGPYLRSDISHQDRQKMCGLFINKGAKMDARGINKMTVLHSALQKGEKSFIVHAINEANKKRFDINLKDQDGCTPLDYIANNLFLYNEKIKISSNFLKDFPLMNQFIYALNLCGAKYNYIKKDNISEPWNEILEPLNLSTFDLKKDLTLYQPIKWIVREMSSKLLLLPENLQAIEKLLLEKLLMLLLIAQGSFAPNSSINSINQNGMTPLDCAISTLNFLNEEKKRNESYRKQMQSLKIVFSEMFAVGAKLNKTNGESLSNYGLIELLGLESSDRESERLQGDMAQLSPIYSFFNGSEEDRAIEKVLEEDGNRYLTP